MSYMRFVCLLASTLTTAGVLLAVAQSPALQRGISVQMPVTHNAKPVPDADKADAWIVTVTRDGALYFGTEVLSADGLLSAMRSRPRNRSAKLYVKVDAAAPYAGVQKVLADARANSFDRAVLLTSQQEPTAPGTMIPPEGLEVRLDPESSEPRTPLIQVVSAWGGLPVFKVNGRNVERHALRDTLGEPGFRTGIQPRALREADLEADGEVDFVDVVHVIDVCESLGREVLLR